MIDDCLSPFMEVTVCVVILHLVLMILLNVFSPHNPEEHSEPRIFATDISFEPSFIKGR